MEFVDCLQCGGGDHETVLIASDPVTGIGGHFRIVRCRDCGLAFTNPRPTVESIGRFYPDDYAPHQQREGRPTLRQRLHERLEQAVLCSSFGYPPAANLGTKALGVLGRFVIRGSRQRQTWIPFRSPGRLLDFGCGAGEFLRKMSRFGWRVEGLDISAETARRVSAAAGRPVHVGTLPHPDLEPASFDAVTLWNSLEHVHDPRATVRAAAELLRPGGLLVVGLQNFDSLSAKLFREHWDAIDLPRHLTHFTPATLRTLLESEGLRVQSLDQIERVGWIRHSARRQRAASDGTWRTKLLTWKPAAKLFARWTRFRGRADALRAVAVKHS